MRTPLEGFWSRTRPQRRLVLARREDRVDAEAGVAEDALGVALRLSDHGWHVDDLGVGRALGHDDHDLVAALQLRACLGSLLEHGADWLLALHRLRAGDQAGLLDRADRVLLKQAHVVVDLNHAPADRDADLDLCARVDLLAGLRNLADHRAGGRRLKTSTTKGSRLASSRAVTASFSSLPSTSGTVITSLPVETTSVTSVEGSTRVPAAGRWLITRPISMSSLA